MKSKFENSDEKNTCSGKGKLLIAKVDLNLCYI